MRIVSWNVHRCIGTDRHYRPERTVEVLRSLNADVIALQEIDSSLRSEDGTDQLEYISRALDMPAVMGPTMHRDYGAYGNAILTKHEVLACEEVDLTFRKFEPRGAIAITMQGPHGPIRVINTHLGLKYWERSFQIDRLLSDYVWRGEESVILTGDFNEWLRYSVNNFRLEKSFSERTPRIATFPARWPRFALDRVFCSGRVRTAGFEIPRTDSTRVASDHLPIAVDLDFEKTFS